MRGIVAGLAIGGCVVATGCQANYTGQVLPSPWYLKQDVQFFAPGPEFPLTNQAADIDARRAELISEPQQP